MKSKLNYLYWSLPLLFVITWFLLTLVFTPIYESFYREARVEGLSPRVGMILLSPILLSIAAVLFYSLLYIERKLIYNWKVIIGITALLMITVLWDVGAGIAHAISDTSKTAEWGYYHALEVGLKYIPFILASFFTLSRIKKDQAIAQGEAKDIFYTWYYLLPLIYVLYSGILCFILTKSMEFGSSAACESLIKKGDNLGIAAALTMPVCILFLSLYKKAEKSRLLFSAVTIASTTVIAAYWCYLFRGLFPECTIYGIVIICLLTVPWTVASHYIAKRCSPS